VTETFGQINCSSFAKIVFSRFRAQEHGILSDNIDICAFYFKCFPLIILPVTHDYLILSPCKT